MLSESGDPIPSKEGQTGTTNADQSLLNDSCGTTNTVVAQVVVEAGQGTSQDKDEDVNDSNSHYGTPENSEAGDKNSGVNDGEKDAHGKGDGEKNETQEEKEDKKTHNWGTSVGIVDESGKSKRVVKLEEVKNRIALKFNDKCPFQFHVNLIDERHPRYLRKERGNQRWRMRYNIFADGVFLSDDKDKKEETVKEEPEEKKEDTHDKDKVDQDQQVEVKSEEKEDEAKPQGEATEKQSETPQAGEGEGEAATTITSSTPKALPDHVLHIGELQLYYDIYQRANGRFGVFLRDYSVYYNEDELDGSIVDMTLLQPKGKLRQHLSTHVRDIKVMLQLKFPLKDEAFIDTNDLFDKFKERQKVLMDRCWDFTQRNFHRRQPLNAYGIGPAGHVRARGRGTGRGESRRQGRKDGREYRERLDSHTSGEHDVHGDRHGQDGRRRARGSSMSHQQQKAYKSHGHEQSGSGNVHGRPIRSTNPSLPFDQHKSGYSKNEQYGRERTVSSASAGGRRGKGNVDQSRQKQLTSRPRYHSGSSSHSARGHTGGINAGMRGMNLNGPNHGHGQRMKMDEEYSRGFSGAPGDMQRNYGVGFGQSAGVPSGPYHGQHNHHHRQRFFSNQMNARHY